VGEGMRRDDGGALPMSKTSGRQARKRKLREQRQRFGWEPVVPPTYTVPYEKHAAVVRELERVSAVLADLIESQQGAAVPAREVVSWVRNPAAVHHLLASSGLQGIGTEDDTCCAGCGCDVDRPHDRSCTVFNAWWVLGMVSAQRSIDIAMEAAQAEDRARSIRRYDVTFRPPINVVSHPNVRPGTAYLMNPADFALPRTIAGRMEQAQQLVELGRVMPAEYARFLSSPDLGETFRREYLGEFPVARVHPDDRVQLARRTRELSDGRGLEAVKDDARGEDVLWDNVSITMRRRQGR